MKELKKIVESKLFIFLIQCAILYTVVNLVGYSMYIPISSDTSFEQHLIINFLSDYMVFKTLQDMVFMFLLWFLVSFIPAIIYLDYKKSYSVNLLTFFIINYFYYVFLYKYARIVFDSVFSLHFSRTIVLGLFILLNSFIFPLIFEILIGALIKRDYGDFELVYKRNRSVCPNCGEKFESIPIYCCNCNATIKNEVIKNQ